MKSLFLTEEQSNHLQELGLKMYDSKFTIVPLLDGEITTMMESGLAQQMSNENIIGEITPTYTLQEIYDKLPKSIETSDNVYFLVIELDDIKYTSISHRETIKAIRSTDKSVLENAYEMLCWVLENNFLKQIKL